MQLTPTPIMFGYVELAYANQARMQYADIQNAEYGVDFTIAATPPLPLPASPFGHETDLPLPTCSSQLELTVLR